jgi:hypothetical protein
LKKSAGSVRFYKPKTEKKTEPNRKKRDKPKKPSQTGFGSFFLKKIQFGFFF